jgi:hypothetical protein
MKFAKIVFWIAGLFGLIACVGLYMQPGSYVFYGIIGTLIAWQIAFIMIALDPVRYRPIMLTAVLEKLLWSITLAWLHLKGQVTAKELVSGVAPHGLLGVLFVLAYYKTPPRAPAAH